ncbi:15840_t:CDS:1, partial [Racocetra persica]
KCRDQYYGSNTGHDLSIQLQPSIVMRIGIGVLRTPYRFLFIPSEIVPIIHQER